MSNVSWSDQNLSLSVWRFFRAEPKDEQGTEHVDSHFSLLRDGASPDPSIRQDSWPNLVRLLGKAGMQGAKTAITTTRVDNKTGTQKETIQKLTTHLAALVKQTRPKQPGGSGGGSAKKRVEVDRDFAAWLEATPGADPEFCTYADVTLALVLAARREGLFVLGTNKGSPWHVAMRNTTDADSAERWVAAMRTHLRRGADVVAGALVAAASKEELDEALDRRVFLVPYADGERLLWRRASLLDVLGHGDSKWYATLSLPTKREEGDDFLADVHAWVSAERAAEADLPGAEIRAEG